MELGGRGQTKAARERDLYSRVASPGARFVLFLINVEYPKALGSAPCGRGGREEADVRLCSEGGGSYCRSQLLSVAAAVRGRLRFSFLAGRRKPERLSTGAGRKGRARSASSPSASLSSLRQHCWTRRRDEDGGAAPDSCVLRSSAAEPQSLRAAAVERRSGGGGGSAVRAARGEAAAADATAGAARGFEGRMFPRLLSWVGLWVRLFGGCAVPH